MSTAMFAGDLIFGLPALYVVPVSIVFTACLIVFALGFKSSAPLPPSFDGTSGTGHGNNKKKNKSKASASNNVDVNSKSKNQQSSNKSQANVSKVSTPKPSKTSSVAQQQVQVSKVNEKPKAVVKPLPAEVVEAVEGDVDGGDWIPVLSEKQKKKASKAAKDVISNETSNKSGANKSSSDGANNKKNADKSNRGKSANVQGPKSGGPLNSVEAINIQELSTPISVNVSKVNQAVVEKVLAKIEKIENKPAGQLTSQLASDAHLQPLASATVDAAVPKKTKIEVEEWTVEDPDPYTDSKTRASNVNKIKNKLKEKIKQRKESQSEMEIRKHSISSSGAGVNDVSGQSVDKVAPGDKITSEVIKSYDAPKTATADGGQVSKSKKKKSPKKSPDAGSNSGQQVAGGKAVPTTTGGGDKPKPASKAASEKAKHVEAGKGQSSVDVPSAPKVPSDSGSSTHSSVSVIPTPSTTTTHSSDVTDATVSDQSEGEFKVVQRKQRKSKK